jgi:uncharacterized membrane protein YjgN (DUF898 family)
MDSRQDRHGIDAYRLHFSGRGSEYFRVWIVNLLLSILTAGLYTPWARRRTVRYFYDHTVVAGSPLEFAAPLRKMVFGFVIFALLYIAFKIASETGQDTAVTLFILAAALLAPYVWGSAMRFRLASTRWRGLQLNFAAGWKEIYFASWPIFVMALLWLAINHALEAMAPLPPAPPVEDAADAPLAQVTPAMWGLIALGVVLSLLCIIRVEFNYRSLLVLRGGIGQQRGRWKPRYADFVRIWLTTVAVFSVIIMPVVGALALLFGGAAMWFAMEHGGPGMAVVFLLVFVGGVLLMLVASAPARAYREARMFQLIWNNVGLSQVARFKTGLQPWAFVRLRIRNVLLTLLTLGFFRPFARVSEYRMKVDSVTLHVKGGLDQLVGQLVTQQEGLGDMLADAAGLDIVG